MPAQMPAFWLNLICYEGGELRDVCTETNQQHLQVLSLPSELDELVGWAQDGRSTGSAGRNEQVVETNLQQAQDQSILQQVLLTLSQVEELVGNERHLDGVKPNMGTQLIENPGLNLEEF